ncbi:hypothetical protein V8B97DRAFT_1536109 [Scleroderma yunnanense]
MHLLFMSVIWISVSDFDSGAEIGDLHGIYNHIAYALEFSVLYDQVSYALASYTWAAVGYASACPTYTNLNPDFFGENIMQTWRYAVDKHHDNTTSSYLSSPSLRVVQL